MLLGVAVLVKVKMSGGLVFFVQEREGKDGKFLNCHKFRTMMVKEWCFESYLQGGYLSSCRIICDG